MSAIPPLSASRTVVWHLGAINAVSFLAQIVQIGTVPPALALRLESTGTSSAIVGLVAAAPWLAILVVARFVPRMLHRYGFLSCTLIGLALSALPLVGMAATSNPWVLFVLNLAFGAGLIVRWVACDTWIVATAPPQFRGRAIGTHETLMGCGIAMGPILLAMSSPLQACCGLLALAACFLVPLRTANVSAPRVEAPSRRRIVSMFATVIAAGAVAGLIETSSISFVPVIASREGWALGAAASLFGFGLGGTLLQVPLGWLADAAGYRVAQLTSAALLLGGALLIPLVATEPLLLAPLLFLWGGAAGGMNTLAVIEAGQRSSAEQTSTLMTSIALAYTLGSVVGPVFTGVAQSAAPQYGLSLVAGSAAAAFLVLRARARA